MSSDGLLPTVEAYQRHELTLMRMEDILNRGSETTTHNNNGIRAQNGTGIASNQV